MPRITRKMLWSDHIRPWLNDSPYGRIRSTRMTSKKDDICVLVERSIQLETEAMKAFSIQQATRYPEIFIRTADQITNHLDKLEVAHAIIEANGVVESK